MCLEFLQGMLSKNFRDFRTCFFLLVLSSPVVQLSMINHRSYAPPSRWRVLRLGYYTTSGALCQEVLKNFFQNLFENLFENLSQTRRGCSLPDSLLIIAHRPLFVKGVFQFFSNFFGEIHSL